MEGKSLSYVVTDVDAATERVGPATTVAATTGGGSAGLIPGHFTVTTFEAELAIIALLPRTESPLIALATPVATVVVVSVDNTV